MCAQVEMLWSEGVGCRRVNNWLDLGLKKKTVMVCTLPEDQFQAWFPQGSGPVSVSDLLGEVDAPYQGGDSYDPDTEIGIHMRYSYHEAAAFGVWGEGPCLWEMVEGYMSCI